MRELVATSEADLVLNAITGSAGLGPTIVALTEGIDLALANKESLVVGGELITALAEATQAQIIPVDSEHSALFQLINGEAPGTVEKLVLTASGGPFREREDLSEVTIDEALAHPTWEMGGRITIDSATLFNKGLELIEAHHLFNVPYSNIDVVVHPQSIIHSLIHLNDGASMAHLGYPDMRVPISYALHYPDRADVALPSLDLAQLERLTFEEPDLERFPCLRLAREAGEAGGTAPCVLNAADEVAVSAFLNGEIPFTAIARVVARTLEEMPAAPPTHFDDLIATDSEARRRAARGGRGRALMSWFLAFAGFAALVILHEAGHFTAAKMVGMKVERFYLFFPPKLFSIQRGETEYGIGAIPLGGFVKITGMNPDEEIPAEDAHRAYYASPVWKRIFVIAAGPFVNIVIAFVIFFALFSTGSEGTNEVSAVLDDGAAVGILQPGDKLVSVDGVTGDFDALREQIATHTCANDAETDGCEAETAAEVALVRNGNEITKTITPVYSEEAGRMLVGFEPGTAPISASGAVDKSTGAMWAITSGTAEVFANIFDAEQRKQISGVVGSYETTRQAIEFDARRALFILGVISLSLAIINLFPFLPLDGGHIFWSIVEKIRGRPVSFSVMERASVLGIILVAMLFVIGLSNDIGRLGGEGFDIR